MARQITLDEYLAILRQQRPGKGPFANVENSAHLEPAFLALAHALADWIDATRLHSPEGYKGGYEVARGMVTYLPRPLPDGGEVLAEAVDALHREATTLANLNREPAPVFCGICGVSVERHGAEPRGHVFRPVRLRPEDEGPHSGSCTQTPHLHGADCARSCPTCVLARS